MPHRHAADVVVVVMAVVVVVPLSRIVARVVIRHAATRAVDVGAVTAFSNKMIALFRT